MAKQPQGRILVIVVASIFILFWLLRRTASSTTHREYAAPVVMLLATPPVPESDKKGTAYLKKVIENREEYAHHHGYKFIVKTLRRSSNNIQAKSTVDSWSRLYALREALEEYPDSEWFWYLDQDAIIMDPEISITGTILGNLESNMLRDVPVVPPDSVIRTLKTGSSESMQFILSQDYSGLNTKSFLLRNSDFAKYLLEAWTEPVRIFPTLAWRCQLML